MSRAQSRVVGIPQWVKTTSLGHLSAEDEKAVGALLS